MKIRFFAQFTTDLPDDTVETDDEIIRYGGRNIAEAFGEILRNLGYTVDAPVDLQEIGWEYNFYLKPHTFANRVTMFEDGVYYTSFRGPSRLFRGPHPAWIEMLRKVGEALASDPRFPKLCWSTGDELDLGEFNGHARPVED